MDSSKYLKLALAVGKVLSTNVVGRARVSVQLNRFNEHLAMYFPEYQTLEVHNPGDCAKVGDLVLIKKLKKKLRNVETHEIEEVIYCSGFIVDPMTGLRVKEDKYLSEPVLDEETRKSLSDSIKPREIAPKFSFQYSIKEKISAE